MCYRQGKHWSRRENLGGWCHCVGVSMSQLPPLDGEEDGLYLSSFGGSNFLPFKTPHNGNPTSISPFCISSPDISLSSSPSYQNTFPNFSFSTQKDF